MKDAPKKDGEKAEKNTTIVFGAAALIVFAVLCFIWGIYIVKKVRAGQSIDSPIGGGQDVFDFSQLDQATRDYADRYEDSNADIRQVQEESADRNIDQLPYDEQPADPFGSNGGF